MNYQIIIILPPDTYTHQILAIKTLKILFFCCSYKKLLGGKKKKKKSEQKMQRLPSTHSFNALHSRNTQILDLSPRPGLVQSAGSQGQKISSSFVCCSEMEK